MKKIINPYDPPWCFFGGNLNPVGPRLIFQVAETNPDELICRWTPPSVFSGYGNVLHGGIQSGIFDETMGWTAYHRTGLAAITASLSVEFLKPVLVEQEIEVRCRMESRFNSKAALSAEMRNESGEVCSKASGTFQLMEADRLKRVMGQE